MSRVLIVDDDGVACETLSRFVRVSGFEVLTAPTSTEGLQLARTIQPDVIVLDDCFPEGPSGRDVLRTLRQERHTAPVIMISGYGTCETVFEAARLGAVDYLTKPVFGDALVEAVKSPPAVVNRAGHQFLASTRLALDERAPPEAEIWRMCRRTSRIAGLPPRMADAASRGSAPLASATSGVSLNAGRAPRGGPPGNDA